MAKGGEERRLTSLQAAEQFYHEHLPTSLASRSLCLPQEIIDYGTTTQGFFSQNRKEKRPKKKKGSALKATDDKELYKFERFGEHLTGRQTELEVIGYMKSSLAKEVHALFWSYEQSRVYNFLGSRDKIKNQEYDLVILLPSYKKFVVVEVKTHAEFQAKDLSSLRKGDLFFADLLGCINESLTENQRDSEWSYLPVLALPNKCQRDQQRAKFNSSAWLEFAMITSAEMKTNFLEVLTKDQIIPPKQAKCIDDDNVYAALVKVLFASAHAERVTRSKGNIGLRLEDETSSGMTSDLKFSMQEPACPVNDTHVKLIGEDEDPISAGFSSDMSLHEDIKFSDLKHKPLGSIESFIFWNSEQYKIIQSIQYKDGKQVVFGDFGTGKTLILMAVIHRYNGLDDTNGLRKIIFVCDRKHTKRVFEDRIETYCMLNRVRFEAFDLSEKKGREKFLELAEQHADYHIVVDEMDIQNFQFVSESERSKHFRKITCVINPNCDFTKVYMKMAKPGWGKVMLSKVMRNSRRIYTAALNHEPENAECLPSTVLGPTPNLVVIQKCDLYLGLLVSLSLIRDDKFVILHDDAIKESTITKAVREVIPNVPISSIQNNQPNILDAKKGCSIMNRTAFGGMEARSILLVGDANQPTKDPMLRCTTSLTNLIYTSSSKNISSVHLHLRNWNVVIPYQENTDRFRFIRQLLIKTQQELEEGFNVPIKQEDSSSSWLEQQLQMAKSKLKYKQYSQDEADNILQNSKPIVRKPFLTQSTK